MTVIVEKRGDTDFIFGFVVFVAALVAWRAATTTPIAAGISAIVGVGAVALWIRWRRKPVPFLAISADEIVYGRIDQRGTVIRRNESGRLEFSRDSQSGMWSLQLADEPKGSIIGLLGFNPQEVAEACANQGWVVA